jgi:hypothetical protein
MDERAEVDALARQSQEAEELAGIADGILSSDPAVDEALRRLRTKLERDRRASG